MPSDFRSAGQLFGVALILQVVGLLLFLFAMSLYSPDTEIVIAAVIELVGVVFFFLSVRSFLKGAAGVLDRLNGIARAHGAPVPGDLRPIR